MQIHDEIVIEVRNDLAKAGAETLRTCMETAWQLEVPLDIQLRAGPSWGEMQAINEVSD